MRDAVPPYNVERARRSDPALLLSPAPVPALRGENRELDGVIVRALREAAPALRPVFVPLPTLLLLLLLFESESDNGLLVT